jgi:hypothetical protein
VTAGPRALQLVRVAYGTALLIRPGPVIQLAAGRPPGQRVCRVARVLGARHVAQAALTAGWPAPGLFAAGAAADAVHAASMLLLAAISGPGRRVALADAAVETTFAVAGLTISARRV